MTKRIGCLLALLSVGLVEHGMAAAQVDHLRCEYRENPLGIDSLSPRLSWNMESSEHGQRQTAYRVLVASSPETLNAGKGDLWDSGKVESDQSLHVRYAGKPPRSRQACHWSVTVWDKEGQSYTSAPARWEIGLTTSNDWNGAQWMQLERDTRTSPLIHRTLKSKFMDQAKTVQAFPSPLFRREFMVRPDSVRARAYVCGLGYNELYINGRKCGDAVLDPGQTSYDKRAFYVTHDITAQLQVGENAVGFMLGNGFYGQNQAFNAPGLAYDNPAIRAKIVIDYADGTSQTIMSDGSWKCDTGPILYDNVYGGETYDARLEKSGWNTVGYDDSNWQAVKVVDPTIGKLQAQMIPPIRRIKILPAKRMLKGVDGKWIVDLGQNIAGWPRIKVNAPAGTQLTMRCAEILTADEKQLDLATIGVHATGLEQMDVYVCKGGGTEIWEPRFTYHGFRYVEVDGLPGKPVLDFLEGVLVRTDVADHGSFECSDETLNEIYRTSLWTIEDNMHSTMEDCPHREKCAWLGDAHAVGETSIFNYDMAQFWTKFVDDIETVLGQGGITYWKQKATPGIPCNIAVGRRLCQEARPDWGSAYVLLPWYLYTYYGDTDVFTRHYDHLKRWIDYVKTLREDGIVIRGYGDWCPPGGNSGMEAEVPLTSTAFFYSTLTIMAEFAEQLDLDDDVRYFQSLEKETRSAFNKMFFDEQAGGYGSQTADAVALRFGLVPDGQEGRVAASLRSGVVEQHNGHAFAGIHGARPLYTQLCEYGFEDVAIRAMKKETFPSYAHALSLGLTTWPELLDKTVHKPGTAGRSLNHPMQSGFAAWFHESIGGIRPAAPGFKKIELKPHGYTQLAWAKAEHESPYGMIKSHWQVEDGVFSWQIVIPPNTTAIAHVPTANGRELHELGSGSYEFKSNLLEKKDLLTVENSTMKIGIDRTMGASITWLSWENYPKNMINIHDPGRLIQQSYYAGRRLDRTAEGQAPAWSPWSWNPIQGGGVASWARVTEFKKSDNLLYAETVPKLWDMPNEEAEALMQQWTGFEPNMPNVAVVKCKLICQREEGDRWGPATMSPQELPACYFTRNFEQVKSYLGDGRWRDESQPAGPPWGRTKPPRKAMACFEENGQGVAIFSPTAELSWNFGPHVNAMSDDPAAGPCMHVAPINRLLLGPKTQYTYRYWLIAGTEAEIVERLDALWEQYKDEKAEAVN